MVDAKVITALGYAIERHRDEPSVQESAWDILEAMKQLRKK